MDPKRYNLNFTLAVTALSNYIAEQLDNDDLELLSAVLNQASDVMSTILALRTNGQLDEKNEAP